MTEKKKIYLRNFPGTEEDYEIKDNWVPVIAVYIVFIMVFGFFIKILFF